MQLEPGKYYRTRDGRKIGPMEDDGIRNNDGYYDFSCGGDIWMRDGTHGDSIVKNRQADDLIAEWQDTTTEPNHAADAAKYGICITVTVGDVSVTYDGRAE